MRLVVVLSIVVWYVLTAISSISLKQALTSSAETLTPLITPLWSSVLVSILPCLGFLLPTVRAATTSSINNNSNPKWVMILLGLIQGLYILTLFLSFSLEGVALTYTIKALEPMGNLILLKLLGRPAHVTQLSFLGLCFLPYGIYLSQHQSENWGSRGLGFALFNVALTSIRSVLLKLYTYNPVMSYLDISAIGLLFLIVAVLNVGFDDFAPVRWMTSPNLFFGVTSFVGYNLASFFVLSNIDPVLHGACNVLKRCTTVALAIVMIPQEAAMLTPRQLFGVGFTLVALGVYVYGRTTRSNDKIRLVRRLLTAMVSLQYMFTINQSIYLPTMQTANFNSMDRHTHNYVVWTFPFAPPTGEGGGGVGEGQHRSEYSEQYQGKDYTFICPYRNACQEFGDHSLVSGLSPSFFQLNLRSLISVSSNFYQYVRDHAYHKVRHGKDFPLHIQAIAMISLLSKNPGTHY